MSEKTCPNCGAALMPGDVFCGECGMRVQEADYGTAPASLPNDVSAGVLEEPLAREPTPVTAPTVGGYVSPPPAKEKESGWTAARIIAVVAAVGFLLGSLCLCSFGGLALIPTESTTRGEDLGFAMALCFAPGVILGLLGVGAAYFGFKRQ